MLNAKVTTPNACEAKVAPGPDARTKQAAPKVAIPITPDVCAVVVIIPLRSGANSAGTAPVICRMFAVTPMPSPRPPKPSKVKRIV